MPTNSSIHAKPCDVCLSPIRMEIENLLENRVSQREIAIRYASKFLCGVNTLRAKLSRHKNKHLGMFGNLRQQDSSESYRMTTTSLEAMGDSLLKIGSKIIKEQPEKVNLRDVVSLQKLLLDRQRMSASNDSLKLSMARFFGGFM
jgi:hypothetical protein